MAANAVTLLRVVGVSKRFGGLAALDAVSLEVRVGEIYATNPNTFLATAIATNPYII